MSSAEDDPLVNSTRYGSVMSTPNINRLVEEAAGGKHAKFNRSSSVGPGMTASNLNPQQRNRRALYVNLPFFSVYGMQYREKSIAKSLSKISLQDLDIAGQAEYMKKAAEDEAVVTWPLIAAVLVAVLLEFLVGFNIGVMNAPEKVVFPGHTTAQWSIAVSVFAIGGPFGAVLAGTVSNKSGRRGAIIVNTWIYLVGGLLFSLAPSVLWLIPARFMIGFACGFSSVVIPIYLGELAPPTLRGTLGTMTQFALVIGILGSNLLAFPLATAGGWRWMFALTPILALVELMCMPLIFESPRWLLAKDEYSMEARLAISKLRGITNDEEVQIEIDHMLEAMSAQRTSHNSAHSRGAVLDLFTDERQRLLVISFVILHAAQQLTGINAIFYYSNSFFVGIIDNPLVGTSLVGVVNVVATYVALQLMDKTGRIPLMMWSTGGMLASTVVVTLSLLGFLPNVVAVFGVMAFVTFFEIGLGPIPWLIVAEMFDAKYVATAMSIACQVNWASNFVVGIGWPYMHQAMGPYSFVTFGSLLLTTFLFTWQYLPETAGRSHAEVLRAANEPRRRWGGLFGGPSSSSVVASINNDGKRGGMDQQQPAGMEYVVVEGVDLSLS
eukprot:g3958.t1